MECETQDGSTDVGVCGLEVVCKSVARRIAGTVRVDRLIYAIFEPRIADSENKAKHDAKSIYTGYKAMHNARRPKYDFPKNLHSFTTDAENKVRGRLFSQRTAIALCSVLTFAVGR